MHRTLSSQLLLGGQVGSGLPLQIPAPANSQCKEGYLVHFLALFTNKGHLTASQWSNLYRWQRSSGSNSRLSVSPSAALRKLGRTTAASHRCLSTAGSEPLRSWAKGLGVSRLGVAAQAPLVLPPQGGSGRSQRCVGLWEPEVPQKRTLHPEGSRGRSRNGQSL